MSHEGAAASLGVSERRMLLLVALVQFVNILDFMMVMPLGPDFAIALDIPVAHLGFIGGSYTASAAVAGLVASRFLDRFDRRSALAVTMLGLVIGTALGGLATGLPTLILARVLAGAFGGPATSVSLSIIADVIPPARRGRALGTVMSGFAVASVLGVPAGLELARVGGWRLPFFAVAALGLAVAASAIFMMPSLRLHLAHSTRTAMAPVLTFLRRPTVAVALISTFTLTMANFMVIPNLSAYVQHNLGYPRAHLGMLYLVGGSISYAAMMLGGGVIDRVGAAKVAAVGTVFYAANLAGAFIAQLAWLTPLAIFALFMTSTAFRAVSVNALSSRVPGPHERARFMSLQSAMQHMGSAVGAMLSSQMLNERPDHGLLGMPQVAVVALVIGVPLPLLMHVVERRVNAAHGGQSAADQHQHAASGGAAKP